MIISKGEPPVDLNPTGGRSDSDSSVHVKCVSESELSRSPTSVEGEVPIGRQGSHYCINAKVIVYAVLSGMISFLPDGTIHGCNHHFVLMLFGYSQQELLKKVHTTLFVPSRCTGMKLKGVLVQSCSRPHIHVASFPGLPSLIPRPSQPHSQAFPLSSFRSLAVCRNGGGSPDILYHVNDVSVYLGRQRGLGGVPHCIVRMHSSFLT